MDQCREDSQHVLPPMPGGRDPVGDSVQATDDGRGTFLPGATEGTGPVQGVGGGHGSGVFGVGGLLRFEKTFFEK